MFPTINSFSGPFITLSLFITYIYPALSLSKQTTTSPPHPTPSTPSLKNYTYISLCSLVYLTIKRSANMSWRNNRGGGGGSGRGSKLDLKLHLSPPRPQRAMTESPNNQPVNMSPASSCLSSEPVSDETGLQYSSSPEATSMMLVGCPQCLMYIMLAENYPKCPKCKTTVLLDVGHDNVKETKRQGS